MKNTKSLLVFMIVIAFALCLVAFPGVKAVNIDVTVEVKKSDNTALSGVEIWYESGGWYNLGPTDALGQVKVSLPSGSYQFAAKYGGATAYLTQDIGVNPLVSFKTTLVTVGLQDHSGGYTIDRFHQQE